MEGLTGSEQSARSAVENAHEAYICMDAGGFITDWNPQAEVTFGWSRDEAIGRVLAETIIPDRFREEHWRGLTRFIETGDATILNTRLELSALHREGYEFPVEITISNSGDRAHPTFYAFLHDISERQRSDQFLRAQHALSATLAEAQSVEGVLPEVTGSLAQTMGWARAGYWAPEGEQLRCRLTWSSDGNHDGKFAQVSRRTLLGPGEGLPGQAWESTSAVWMADVSMDPAFVRGEAARAEGLHSAVAVPVAAGSGTRGVLEFLSLEAKPRQAELVEMMTVLSAQAGHFLDVLEERAGLIQRLERLAATDELTGVSNRRGWEEALNREIARSRRDGAALYVALFDLDDFKQYNDEHGHQAGDDLLRQTAAEWSSRLRATDILARYGGEEFALVFPTHPPETAAMVVERLRAAMAPGVTCSAGLAAWNRVESAEELVGRADGALYEAKRAGRDCLVQAEA